MCIAMGKQQANYRLDESLLDALKDRANTEGVSTTDIVTKALQQYLGVVYQPAIQPAIQSDVSLDQRIAVLKQELTANLQDAINSRLIIIESTVSGLRTDRHIEKTDALLIEKLQTDLAIAHHRIDDLDKMIANIKISETISPKKSKPLASIAA